MRILLADDDTKVRSAIRLILEQDPDVTFVGEAEDTNNLLNLAQTTRPELVLLDWELPELHQPARVLTYLREYSPNLKVIALSGHRQTQKLAIALGADLFVCKADPPEKLLDAVDRCKTLHNDSEKQVECK